MDLNYYTCIQCNDIIMAKSLAVLDTITEVDNIILSPPAEPELKRARVDNMTADSLVAEVITSPKSTNSTLTLTLTEIQNSSKKLAAISIYNIVFNEITSGITISSFKTADAYSRDIVEDDDMDRGYNSEGQIGLFMRHIQDDEIN